MSRNKVAKVINLSSDSDSGSESDQYDPFFLSSEDSHDDYEYTSEDVDSDDTEDDDKIFDKKIGGFFGAEKLESDSEEKNSDDSDDSDNSDKSDEDSDDEILKMLSKCKGGKSKLPRMNKSQMNKSRMNEEAKTVEKPKKKIKVVFKKD